MLITKHLITYDPEDAVPVKDLQLSVLPETGKKHMDKRKSTAQMTNDAFFQDPIPAV
jgi:hypothetical protein